MGRNKRGGDAPHGVTPSENGATDAGNSAHMILRIGADGVDGKVGAGELFVFAQPDADRLVEDAVDDEAAGQGEEDGRQGACQLGNEADATHPTQGLLAEDAGGDAAPGADYAVQWPDPQHVIDLQHLLLQVEAVDEGTVAKLVVPAGTAGVKVTDTPLTETPGSREDPPEDRPFLTTLTTEFT